jgi:hypothetical protein
MEPWKVLADAVADPAKVLDNSAVICSNDLVFRSALDMPTPSLESAALLPKNALLNADEVLAKSLPVDAEISNASCNNF